MRYFASLLLILTLLLPVSVQAEPNPYTTQATMQSAATGNVNGTLLNTNIGGYGFQLVTFVVTGTFSATVNPEGTQDGTNWQALFCMPISGGAGASTFTASGGWRCNLGGSFIQVRARISGYASGNVTVTGMASFAGTVANAAYPAAAPSTGDAPESLVTWWAVCDGVTDDTTALQTALNQAGTIVIPTNVTCYAKSANLLLAANSRLVIERGATLKLDGIRLTALNVNDVYVFNYGTILSLNLNTTDPLPTNWTGRGIVEFGGTAATPVQRVGILGPGKVNGSWTGTPGAISIAAQDKRKGILLDNVINGLVSGVDVTGTIAEAIWYSGGTSDKDVTIVGNTIHDCNHDAISSESFEGRDLRIMRNEGWNCASGIEAFVGTVQANVMRDMVVGGGFIFGGNTPLRQFMIRDNIGYNNATVDFSLAGATSPGGTVIAEGNLSINAGSAAYSFQYITNAVILHNTAIGWAQTTASYAFGIGGNVTTAEVFGNLAINAGANSSGGFTVNVGTLLAGLNYAPGVTTPFTGLSASLFNVGSLSGTTTLANNLRGSATFSSAATKAVSFATAEPDATYFVSLSGNANETFWVTAKGTGGFTLNSSNATSTAIVDWHLIR